MPKISARRRDEQHPAEFHSDTIFDVFDEQAPPKAEPKAKTEPTVAELMERLGGVNARLDAQEQERAFAQARPTERPVQVQIGEAPKLNLDGLPDPVTDSQGYARAIAERTMFYQGEMAKFNQARAEASKPQQLGDPDALWEDFKDAHPEYAEDNDRVEFAVTKAVKTLAKRGIDVQKLMYGSPETFFGAITTVYDQTFGSPVEDEQEVVEERPEARRQRRAQPRDEDERSLDEGRTEGIPGGQQGGVHPRGSKEPASDLISDLRAIQRKTGYF